MEFLDPMVKNPDFFYVHNYLVDSYIYAGNTTIVCANLWIVLYYDLQTWLEVPKIKK